MRGKIGLATKVDDKKKKEERLSDLLTQSCLNVFEATAEQGFFRAESLDSC